MAKMDAKRAFRFILLGTGVFWLTGLLAPIIGGFAILATVIPVLNLSLGTLLAAGIAAGIVDYLLEKFYK